MASIDDLPPPPAKAGESSIDDLPPPRPQGEPGWMTAGRAIHAMVNPIGAASDMVFKDQKSNMAGLEHLGNAEAFGYLPHLQAATEPLVAKVGDWMTGEHVADSLPPYAERRDQNIARLKQEEKDNPLASKIGTGAGLLTGAIATSGLLPELRLPQAIGPLTKGAQFVQGLKNSAVNGGIAGGAYMGLSNPGDTPGVVDPVQAGERAKNAAIGTASGAVLSPALGLAGQAATSAGGAIRDFAERRAGKALGPTQRDFQNMGLDGIQKVGRSALDEGVIGNVPRSQEVLGSRAADKAEQIGGQLDDTIQTLSGQQAQAGVPSAERAAIAQSLRAKLIRPTTGNPTIRKANEYFENLIQEYENTGAPLQSLQALREGKLQAKDQVNWRRPKSGDVPQDEQFNRALTSDLAGRETDTANAVDKAINGQESSSVQDLKGRYGQMADAARMAGTRAEKEAANRFISPSDYGAGMTSAMILSRGALNPAHAAEVAGLVGAGAHKVVRTYGNQVVAKQGDTLAKILSQGGPLAEVLQKNPQAAGMLLSKLRQDQNTPEALPEPPVFEQFKNNPAQIDKLPDGPMKSALLKRYNRTPSDEGDIDHTDPKNLIAPDDARKQFREGN